MGHLEEEMAEATGMKATFLNAFYLVIQWQ